VLRREDGSDLIVFHAYDANTGKPALQISPLVWKDGWPLAALGEE
jgi:arabinan endo-1,5-alpha-L-arabinosidase